MKIARLGSKRLVPFAVSLSVALLVLGLAAGTGSVPVSAGSPAPAEDGFGTIKGRLVWGGSTPPTLEPLAGVGKASKDSEVCAAKESIPDEKVVVDPKTLGVRDGVAYLFEPKGINPEAVKALLAKSPKVVMDQKNCQYIPHVVAINKGQVVDFKSSDPVNHNVHVSGFQNPGFNQIIPGNGSIQKTFVPEKNALKVQCDLHGWMLAYVRVYDHPFFAVTAADGSFEIKGVPKGVQKFVLWHPSGYVLKEMGRGRTVTVVAGETLDLGDIKLDPAKALK